MNSPLKSPVVSCDIPPQRILSPRQGDHPEPPRPWAEMGSKVPRGHLRDEVSQSLQRDAAAAPLRRSLTTSNVETFEERPSHVVTRACCASVREEPHPVRVVAVPAGSRLGQGLLGVEHPGVSVAH